MEHENAKGTPMHWKEIYKERLTTAEEAVKLIKSHDHVIFGHCICEPTGLIDAMVANHDAYRGVHITHMVSLGKGGGHVPLVFEGHHVDAIELALGHGGKRPGLPVAADLVRLPDAQQEVFRDAAVAERVRMVA